MKILYIADIHLFHKNILNLSKRPFNEIEEMHCDFIKKWNKKVDKVDTIYIVGDVAFGNSDKVCKILNQLNGNKILIIGNHDRKNLKNKMFCNCFESIQEYCELIDDNRLIVLFHYPIEEWNQYFRGSIHLFGHVHINDQTLSNVSNRYNIGYDRLNGEPCTLKEILHIYKKE